MRANPLWLMAVIPGMWEAPIVPATSAPCTMAIEVHVVAPLTLGTFELHVMAGEVERVWRPYGVTFCWSGTAEGCEGLEVRLRVLVADEATPPGITEVPSRRVLGWIPFAGDRPGTDIMLSDRAARTIVARARVGFRPLGAWPPALGERYVPRVLGRGLAHEIGHYVLRSRAHTRTGLMVASFAPDRVTLDAADRLALPGRAADWLRAQCGAGGEATRVASITLGAGPRSVIVR